MSVLLVIQTIYSTTINESLTDHHLRNNVTRSSIATHPKNHTPIPQLLTLFTTEPSTDNVQQNQSNYTINHAIINDTNSSIDKVKNSKITTTITTTASMPFTAIKQTMKPISSSGKTFNKIDFRKRKVKSVIIDQTSDWMCPITNENSRYLECGCDMPHTLRCSGDIHGLEQIANTLRHSNYSVSLLDCTLKNVTFLSDARIFDNVSLHGLVISSGEIKRLHRLAFSGMKTPLQALGLPNNALQAVPWQSLSSLTSLDRLDLSNNRIKYIGASDFLVSFYFFFLEHLCLPFINHCLLYIFHFQQMLQNLTYLELSDNHISGISMRSFLTLKKLQTLKLNGNRLEVTGNNLLAIGQCVNLK